MPETKDWNEPGRRWLYLFAPYVGFVVLLHFVPEAWRGPMQGGLFATAIILCTISFIRKKIRLLDWLLRVSFVGAVLLAEIPGLPLTWRRLLVGGSVLVMVGVGIAMRRRGDTKKAPPTR